MNSTNNRWMVAGIVIVVIAIIALFYMGAKDVNEANNVNDNSMATSTSGVNSSANNSNTGVNSGSNNGVNGSTNGNTSVNNSAISDEAVFMMIKNARIRVPQTGTDVALTDGVATYKEGSVTGTIKIVRVLGRVSTDDGQQDIFVEMSLSKEKTASVLNYVSLFKSNGKTVTYTSSVLIGDRLTIGGITAKADASVTAKPAGVYMPTTTGYLVTVDYLDRKNGEAITTVPSVRKTVDLRAKNHILSK